MSHFIVPNSALNASGIVDDALTQSCSAHVDGL